MLRFVNSHDAPRLAELGTSCPDHFLRTKIKPLYVDWDPAGGDIDALKAALRARARRSTARTTPPTTSGASRPTRRRCATRTPP